jgi:hypothetical protein
MPNDDYDICECDHEDDVHEDNGEGACTMEGCPCTEFDPEDD